MMKTHLALNNFWDTLHGWKPRFPFRLKRFHEVTGSTLIEAPTPTTIHGFRRFSVWAGIVAIVVGYHVFLGWLFQIDILKTPWQAFSAMKVNEAICSLLAGVALYIFQEGQAPGSRRRLLRTVCASLVVAIAALTLFEYLVGRDLGLDNWFWSLTGGWANGEPLPGRIAFMSSIGFLMIGLAMLLMDSRIDTSEALALVSAALSLLALAGYLYGATAFQQQTPLYSAIVLFLLGIGILSARADRSLMAKVTSNSFGGVMARRLLPATLLIPIILGAVIHYGQRTGLYGPATGLAVFAVGNVLLFLLVIWWGVNSLHRMDTERRRAERELQDIAAKLARSNADLEQFAYVTSHDLKEPLRAISGSVQLFQERYREKLDSSADAIIKHTADGAVRMQCLIDDLLTYSRLTTREAPLAPTNSEETLKEALANLELAIKESKAIVTNDPLPTVQADPTQLLQVFQNLVGNAIKYRSQRTPKIHVSAEDKGAEWLFSVRDNGIGIGAQYVDRIFRIFQRLHTRNEYSGTGIGLAVCKKVIERHGGRIWVESEPEEGSTFFFTLPKS